MEKTKYERIYDDDEVNSYTRDQKSLRRQELWKGIVLIETILLALISLLAFNLYIRPEDIGNYCVDKLGNYHSPILDEVGIRLNKTTFWPGFYKQNAYQKPGSPEVDAAWEALGVAHSTVVVSPEVGKAAGLEGRLRVPNTDDYVAMVEGIHHLHCLNLVRKGLYYNVDYYRELGAHEFQMPEENLRMHIAHCLDTVRQQLMCTADINLLGFVQIEGRHPFPDFGTEHVCRNYEDVVAWAFENESPQYGSKSHPPIPRPGDIVLAEAP